MSPIQIIQLIIGIIMILSSIYVYIMHRVLKLGGMVLVLFGFLLIGIQSAGKIEISLGATGINAKIEKLEKHIEAVQKSQIHFQKTLAVQANLKEQGIYKGPISGILSQPFVSALKDYQKDKGLKASGKIDQKTLESLAINPTQGSKGSFEQLMKPEYYKESAPIEPTPAPTRTTPKPKGREGKPPGY